MTEPSWHPDPLTRHQYRWWDGGRWTERVANDGVEGVDPVGDQEAPPPPGKISGVEERHLWEREALPLASKWARLGAYLLDIVFVALTLLIGWFVWSLFLYGRGQTPAKQVLKMRVVSVATKCCLGWWRMALREWVLKAILVTYVGTILIHNEIYEGEFLMLAWLVYWLASAIMLIADDRNRAAWDRFLGTAVIKDPDGVYLVKPERG